MDQNLFRLQQKITKEVESLMDADAGYQHLVDLKISIENDIVSPYTGQGRLASSYHKVDFKRWLKDYQDVLRWTSIIQAAGVEDESPAKIKAIFKCKTLKKLVANYGNEKALSASFREALKSAGNEQVLIKNRIKALKRNLAHFKKIGFQWGRDNYNPNEKEWQNIIQNCHYISSSIQGELREKVCYYILKEIAQGAAIANHINFLKQENSNIGGIKEGAANKQISTKLRVIALYLNYCGEKVYDNKWPSIAKNYGYKSWTKLKKYYKEYDTPEKRTTFGSKRSASYRIQYIKDVIFMLHDRPTQKQLAENELKKLMEKY